MAKKRFNELCHCRKTGAYKSRSAAEAALERVLDAYAKKPLKAAGYVPTAVAPCRGTKGVWHLTSKSEKVRRGQPRGVSWARGR